MPSRQQFQVSYMAESLCQHLILPGLLLRGGLILLVAEDLSLPDKADQNHFIFKEGSLGLSSFSLVGISPVSCIFFDVIF